MIIQENISLKKYNTFGIEAKAKYFCEIKSVSDLRAALTLDGYPDLFILGGGSNMLITQDLNYLVLYINIKGITTVWEDEDHICIAVNAGENWHGLVLWTLKHNYGGLENLSLIPGNSGTAPIQNIGAYGVELKDTFVSCKAIEIATQKLHQFSKDDCKFGYRESFFKNEGKGKYIITSIQLKLTKRNHRKHMDYGAIASELDKQGIIDPSIQDISNAVVAIRQSKLPNPEELGNSGSFFKNPVLNTKDFQSFISNHPEAPFYKVSETEFKVPAGWLIEKSGFKGKRYGDAGIHKNQALVLVNYGNATGTEIMVMAEHIMATVYKNFKIVINPEVNIIK
ncbi:UDP-N-acetylmuramate dehydrogenase [Arenibacter certesii]|uniref:UDP-N-acetylenolpyruvoylglucosamine reductase n=1 Tax=Arenibacter certesii TaxID=228955 RepID=A0A918INB9_9FLAO|nr:UDP-N-acetylmuramate dehydrogenase [Arenibacter certesii]GGW23058.1 UDP-N-acetylenolpyruvoylglucosamine reductase [Arenibacter certesii]